MTIIYHYGELQATRRALDEWIIWGDIDGDIHLVHTCCESRFDEGVVGTLTKIMATIIAHTCGEDQ